MHLKILYQYLEFNSENTEVHKYLKKKTVNLNKLYKCIQNLISQSNKPDKENKQETPFLSSINYESPSFFLLVRKRKRKSNSNIKRKA